MVFSIFDLFSESRPFITNQDVIRELGLNSVTAHGYLRTLESVGALVSFQRGRYHLGFSLSELAEKAASTNFLSRLIQPRLDEIAELVRETAIAAIYRHGRIIVVARARPPRPYSMNIEVGTELEAHRTANGKLWLACVSDHELERYLSSSDRTAFTKHTLVTQSQLRAEINIIRENGYACCLREREEEISTVGIPVPSKQGKIIAGLSVFGQASRFTDDFLGSSLKSLIKAAEDIKNAMYGESGK